MLFMRESYKLERCLVYSYLVGVVRVLGGKNLQIIDYDKGLRPVRVKIHESLNALNKVISPDRARSGNVVNVPAFLIDVAVLGPLKACGEVLGCRAGVLVPGRREEDLSTCVSAE